MLTTCLTKEWGLRYPVIGAPMANVARGRLAGAISAAGGLGMIGAGPKDAADFIEREASVARAAAGASGKFGIGLMAWALEKRPELLDAAMAAQPFLISISFGSARRYGERLRRAGIRLAAQVNSREAAVEAAEAGADLVVAQGTEAGGHTGRPGTLPLLQIVLAAIDRPVVAAGGVATPAGLAAVLAAGAAGAWMGTPFLLSPESDVNGAARERIREATEADTVLTSLFDRVNRLDWPEQFPGRALRNSFTDQWHGRERELLDRPDEIARFRAGAEEKNYDITSIYAGQAVGLLSTERPAGDVVRWLGDGAEALLRERLAGLLAPPPVP